jgi:hypothetical protein
VSIVFNSEPLYPSSIGITTHVREDQFGCWVYCDESESLELFDKRGNATNDPDKQGDVAGRIAVWEVSSLAAAEVIVSAGR